MSMSVSYNKKDGKTLMPPNDQYDSLCTDEYEIISCDTLGGGANENNDDTVSQWTTRHSINVESTIPMNNLANLLCSTHSEAPSLISGAAADNFGSEGKRQNDVQNKTLNQEETAILMGTVNTVQTSATDSTLVDAPSLIDSYNTLDNVIRSQSETREMLEKAIMSLDSMNKERSELTSKFATIDNLEQEISSLKTRVAELEEENRALKQEKSSSEFATVDKREQEISSLKTRVAELEEENRALKQEKSSSEFATVDKREQEISSLKTRVAELEEQNKALKEENLFTSKFATTDNFEQEISSLKTRVAELEEENKVLKQENLKTGQVLVCEQKSKESETDGDKIAALKQQLSVMQKLLYDRGLEVDTRTKALTEATNELETAYRKIADLTDSQKSAELNSKELSHKLDETFALLLAERERVSIAEEEIRSLRAAGGEGFSFPMTNEQMVAREMREKAVYAQKLEKELEETRKRLDELTKCCAGKDDELKTHMEIINVLKEEDGEGRREIAERDRRIKELEEMMQGMFDRGEKSESKCAATCNQSTAFERSVAAAANLLLASVILLLTLRIFQQSITE